MDRQGEAQQFKRFKTLHNHQLLWHGSRTTNFAGILSQGLRIAPPEAPAVCGGIGKKIHCFSFVYAYLFHGVVILYVVFEIRYMFGRYPLCLMCFRLGMSYKAIYIFFSAVMSSDWLHVRQSNLLDHMFGKKISVVYFRLTACLKGISFISFVCSRQATCLTMKFTLCVSDTELLTITHWG